MTAQDVAAELHALIMEHGLTVEEVDLGQASETSEYATHGEVWLGFLDGSGFVVQVREAA